MIICDILGVWGCQSVPRSPDCLFYHGNKTVILNGQLQQFLLMQYFCLCPLFAIHVFIHIRQQFFLSQLLLLISGDSTFAISDFSSPDDIYISCVSTLMILTSCTCASKSKDKQMSIRMDPATQQLTVFVNITREQSFFFFLNCPAFITRHVRQHPLLWISDVLDSHLLPGGGRVC